MREGSNTFLLPLDGGGPEVGVGHRLHARLNPILKGRDPE
jgi:hypothetical protein